MKKYDHEPTISELLDQFLQEDMLIPAIMPQVKIPVVGNIINKKIKAVLRDTFVNLIITQFEQLYHETSEIDYDDGTPEGI